MAVSGYFIYDIYLPNVAVNQHPDYLCEEHSSSWGSGANVTLTDDSTIYMTRTASLKAVSSGADDVYYYPSTQNLAQDMTGADCLCFWVRSNVTNAIRVSIHTDGTHYLYKDHSLTTANTWEFVIVKFSDMTDSDTFDITDVNYIQIDHKNSNRTLYLDLYAVGRLFEIDLITSITISQALNLETLASFFRSGDILIPFGLHSNIYNLAFEVINQETESKTPQQLIDEVNIIHKYFVRREPLIFHAEPGGLKMDLMRGRAIYPLSRSFTWNPSTLMNYPFTLPFMEYDNADMI